MSKNVFNLPHVRIHRDISEFVFAKKGAQISGDYAQEKFMRVVDNNALFREQAGGVGVAVNL